MKNQILNKYPSTKVVLKFIIPYIILYAIYIQLNGEVSPGGGFQAGVIFATGIVAYSLLFGYQKLSDIFSLETLVFLSIVGVAIYFCTGLVSLLFDDNYLNYYSLATDPIFAQHIGIFLIEIGVGITVSAVMVLIYVRLED